MSYSVFSPLCSQCVERDECADMHVINGAVGAIHMMPSAVHKGAGTIKIECFNFNDGKKVEDEPQSNNPEVLGESQEG